MRDEQRIGFMNRLSSLALAVVVLGVAACDSGSYLKGESARASGPARCAALIDEAAVTRQEIAAGARTASSKLMLRFVHLTDDHIIDDDGQGVIGASVIDPLSVQFESAMRFQEEYSDEVLNDLEARINACVAEYPAEFSIITGDSADLTTVGEIRRFIDNLDGTYDQISRFEQICRASQPEGTPESVLALTCTRFTGRGVADTQTPDPDPENLLFQPLVTRTVLQLTATQTSSILGRASDGSTDVARQTATRAPGMPEILRCNSGTPGCANNRLSTPWYVVFGNHDGYVRGTLPLELGINEAAFAFGRHFMVRQAEFVREFFNSSATPGPIGHGFGFVEPERLNDDDDRNDGYYAFNAGGGKFRMIVLNSIIDGVDPRLPTELLRNPAALADGGMDRAQFTWLQQQLQDAYTRKQLVMVFTHHPDLTFAEYGTFAALVPIDVTAVELDGLLASYPNLIAWVAGHTHRHCVRPFKVTGETGTNGVVTAPVACKAPGACTGFWQIESASLIDFPQEQRLIEVFDNGDGTGTIRGPIFGHGYENSRRLAIADDRCALYLADPASLVDLLTEADLGVLCSQGGTRQGEAGDRNVELTFRMPFQ
jgi:3',5'-cyclic AMP phosphodiesterase CpdA